jgi:DNA-binding protein YbaB
MSIVSKLKQFRDLREQGKKFQNAMSGESVTVNNSGVTLTMNGNMEIDGLAIEDSFISIDKKEKLQNAIKDAHKDALRKMQRIMAQKMQAMGGLEGLTKK